MGSMFSTPSQPPAPDYVGAANAQGQQQMALTGYATNLGRPNQTGPLGSTSWTTDANGNYTQNTQMSPEQQALYWPSILRQGQAGAGAASDIDAVQANAGAFNPTGLTSWGGVKGTPADYETNAYNALMSRTNADLDQQTAKQQTQLANQGIYPGSDAYNNAMQPLERARVDAANQATLNAANLGTNYANRDISLGNFADQQRQQQVGEQLMQRQVPLSEFSTLNAASQPTMPSFPSFGTAGLAAPGVQPALQQYQDAIGRYNADQATSTSQQNAGMGALGAIAAAYFSDPRLKTNVEKVGETPAGHNLYEWDWKDGSGHSAGVMADEVPKSWVHTHPSGYKMVDYSKVK